MVVRKCGMLVEVVLFATIDHESNTSITPGDMLAPPQLFVYNPQVIRAWEATDPAMTVGSLLGLIQEEQVMPSTVSRYHDSRMGHRNRVGADPDFVCQNMHIVHRSP